MPRVVADDMFFLREVLRSGGGVGALPTLLADADLASGALVSVLPSWELFSGTVYLVHPGRKHLPRRVTAFSEMLVEQLRQRPLLP
jgi:DNA-binding transcriptional LysR family regulator